MAASGKDSSATGGGGVDTKSEETPSVEEKVAELLRLLPSKKSNLTKAINEAKKLCEWSASSPSPLMSQKLSLIIDKLWEYFGALEKSLSELIELDEPKKKDYDDAFEDAQASLNSVLADVYKAISSTYTTGGASTVASGSSPSIDAVPHMPGGYIKPNSALKPFTLTEDHKPMELREWQDQFKSFYSTSQLERCSKEDQMAYFRKSIDTKLFQDIRHKLDATTTIYRPGGAMEILQEHFLYLYPYFNRRLDFFRVNQLSGQSFNEYANKIREMSLDADIATLTVEDFIMFRMISGCSDQKLREKFMDLEDPTMDKLIKLGRTYEKNKLANKALTKQDVMTAKVGNGGSGGKGGSKKLTKKDLIGRCFRCGSKPHEDGAVCPAIEKTCFKCSTKGHISSVCLGGGNKNNKSSNKSNKKQKHKNKANAVDSEDDQVSDSEYEEETANAIAITCSKVSESSPRLEVNVSHHTGNEFDFKAMCDTGTSRSLISLDLIRKAGMKMRRVKNHVSLRAANGEIMRCEGKIDLVVRCQGIKQTLNAIVTSDMTHEMLISKNDLIKMEVLPKGFPAVRRSLCYKVEATDEDFDKVKEKFLKDFKDVLCDELKPTPMSGDPVKIYLKEGPIKPFRATRTRPVPLHQQAEAKQIIEQALKDGVIAKVDTPTDWISHAFFVVKEGGKGGLRLVTDYRELNKYVKRPIYPVPSCMDVKNNIPSDSEVFAKLDAVSGYWNVALEEESSYLTTFLTQWGKFRWLRSPMGLSSSSDVWNSRSDDALQGLESVVKIVDDVCVTAPDLPTLIKRIEAVLIRCREYGITMSKRKFKIGNKIKFAGFTVGKDGVTPDPEKVEAITKFPRPVNVTDVRSFLGLANQLGYFVCDLAHATEPLRELLRKDTAFYWDDRHEEAFKKVKSILTSDLVVTYFKMGRETLLITDASRQGIAAILMQRTEDGHLKMIQAFSKSLSDCQKRYSIIELEALGILFGIQKSHFYLQGIEFTVFSDHRPLQNIFSKPLEDIVNPRIRGFREKLAMYNFEVKWIAGKVNLISDALSRAPLFGDEDDEDMQEVVEVKAVFDKNLLEMYEYAKKDKKYQKIIKSLKNGVHPKNEPLWSPIKPYEPFWDRLSLLEEDEGALVVLDAESICVPTMAIDFVLKLIHKGHTGLSKTRALARSLYFFPGMNSAIKDMIENCEECQKLRPSQPEEKLQLADEPLGPLDRVSIDLFELNGRHYLCTACQYSGFVFVDKLTGLKTENVTKCLENHFYDWGFCRVITSDNGPQMRSEFKKWCDLHKITHETSSPHHHRSNSYGEAAVKQCKFLLKKLDGNWKEFRKALLEWRNTARADGFSPAQMLLGRRQRTELPVHPHQYRPIDQQEILRARRAQAEQNAQKRGGREYEKLEVGDRVRIQDVKSGSWNQKGWILRMRQYGRSYELKDDDGKVKVRNRKFLKKISDGEQKVKDIEKDIKKGAVSPRRSERIKNKNLK